LYAIGVVESTPNTVAYSGQSLAITEFAQVSQTVDWWLATFSLAGMIGGGSLAHGETNGGKVAGEVAKNSSGIKNTSDPVLLREQDGILFVIFLEYEK
jgi:hypothetical protein